jgi:F-type H+-transporting ATPase subunit epsilon
MNLSVLTPQGVALEREVDEVTVPGAVGEFGVLEGHVPFVSATKSGVLAFRRGAERGKVAVGPGFAEVDGKGDIAVLVQRAVAPEKIDRAGAEALRAEAEGKLKKGAAGADQRLAQADLDWAEAQLSL